jgi:large subunit ribosomal protein L30
MGKLKVTQIGSGIGRPAVQKRTLKALGLKMNHSVEIDASPQMNGMLAKVQHLVKIENI